MVKLAEAHIQDFQLLWSRSKGDLYCVENNHLRSMGWVERIFYRLSLFFLQTDINHSILPHQMSAFQKKIHRVRLFCVDVLGEHAQKVRCAVSGVIGQVTRGLEPEGETPFEKRILGEFYFEKIATLSRGVYARQIHPTALSLLDQSVDLSEIPQKASKAYQIACRTAKLFAKLGNFELLGGASGAYCIFDQKKRLGVCKFSDEEPLSINNPWLIQKIKRCLYSWILWSSRTGLFKCVAGQAHIAEAAASIIGEHIADAMGKKAFSLVPETHVAQIALNDGRKRACSFQLWINEPHQTANRFFRVGKYYDPIHPMPRPFEQELSDQVVLQDVMTGNMDRHGENWLALQRPEIRLIDGGQSLSPYHPTPGCWVLLRNQYLWKKLPQFNQGFSAVGKEAILRLYKKRHQIRKEIEQLYDQHLPEDRGGENNLRAWRSEERLSVLYLYRNRLKTELAQMRTDEDLKGLACALSRGKFK
ncbi:MAG: hypothetical protein V4487_07875 [Chlamydiota bacterium]